MSFLYIAFKKIILVLANFVVFFEIAFDSAPRWHSALIEKVNAPSFPLFQAPIHAQLFLVFPVARYPQ